MFHVLITLDFAEHLEALEVQELAARIERRFPEADRHPHPSGSSTVLVYAIEAFRVGYMIEFLSESELVGADFKAFTIDWE